MTGRKDNYYKTNIISINSLEIKFKAYSEVLLPGLAD